MTNNYIMNSVIILIIGLVVMSASGCGSINAPNELKGLGMETVSSNTATKIVKTKLQLEKEAADIIRARKIKQMQSEAAQNIIIKRNFRVKGIYISEQMTKGKNMEQLLQMLGKTYLNAIVMDIKNDRGHLTYQSNVPLVKEISSDNYAATKDMSAVLAAFKLKGIYCIGRLVTFKDPFLSYKRPELSIHNKSGSVWRDSKGISWVDPFNKAVWNYNLEIAKEATTLGFDEIQFDYVRFPENGKKMDLIVSYQNPNQWTKVEGISRFLHEARTQVNQFGSLVSADVFGMVTTSKDDMGIGQDWNKISQEVDVISPMLYPSHYSSGIYGVKTPDLQPYSIVKQAIIDAKSKNSENQKINIGQRSAQMRPWLQNFTAKWLKKYQRYGPAQVNLQIKAAKDQGVDQYLLWNSSGKYSY